MTSPTGTGWASPEELAEAKQAIGLFRAIRDAIWECSLPATAKLVALRMVEHLPNIEMSVAGVAEKTSLSERAVRDALRHLEGHRVIITLPSPGRRSKYEFAGQPTPAAGAEVTLSPRKEMPDTPAAGAPLTPAAGAEVTLSPRKEMPDTPAAGAPLTPAAGAPEADKYLKLIGEAGTVPVAPAKPKPQRGKTKIPEDFRPTPQHAAIAKKEGVNLAREFERFVDHWKSNGTMKADWNATLRNWLRNSARFAGNKQGPVAPGSSFDDETIL